MWQLNESFRLHREKLADLLQQKENGMNISDQRLEDARRQVARDEDHAAAIEQAQQAKQATADAEKARTDAFWNQRHEKQEAEIKQRARLAWQGSADTFEAAWPGMYSQILQRQTINEIETAAASVPVIRL